MMFLEEKDPELRGCEERQLWMLRRRDGFSFQTHHHQSAWADTDERNGVNPFLVGGHACIGNQLDSESYLLDQN